MATASIHDTATALNPAIKAKQQAMWASGDFAVIGTTLQIVGEVLCESIDVRSTERVLDVAAGNGNATLAAARRFARVTSTDYVSALLERGRRRADAEGLDIIFETADAEALPYHDASFDVVVVPFVITLVPDPAAALREVARVLRPGGEVIIASWFSKGVGLVGRLEEATQSALKGFGWNASFPISFIENWARSSDTLFLKEVSPLAPMDLFTLVRVGKKRC